MSPAQVVLEELLSSAIESALEARGKMAAGDKFQEGLLMAYYDIITWAKTQADIVGIEFADKNIAAFDPDKELLRGKKRVTA